MQTWARRLRGAIGRGVAWAAGWAAVGILIGVASTLLPGAAWDAFFKVFDAPLPALAVPGFFGGVIFSAVLGLAGRRRRFAELSLPRFAAWGALGGLLLSLLPAALAVVGLASVEGGTLGLWELTAVIGGPLILLCTASATASLALARNAQKQELLPAAGDASRPTGHAAGGAPSRS